MTIGAFTAAFRSGSDDPVRACERARAAADAGIADGAIRVRVDEAQGDAKASYERYRRGAPLGPLDGVPIAIKDCIDVAGVPTSNGTRFLTTCASTDAVLVQRLRTAGAVVFAKTNMHEFGIQPTGINPHHGTPLNAWDHERIPGGSSSGSAVAVATGVVPVAVGTDAGGSIRVPAAINGVVGLKPTFGAVPMQGVSALTTDLDHAGPIARSVEDATLVFETLSGSAIDRATTFSNAASLSDFFVGADSAVTDGITAAQREVFGDIPRVPSPYCEWAAAVEFVIVATDAQRTCAQWMKDHARDIAPDTRLILRLGAGLTAADRQRADRVRIAMRRELDALLETYDVLVAPAIGCVAPLLRRAAKTYGELDTATMAQLAAPAFVTNLTGHPCVVVPCSREGLPMSMQIIGRMNDEAKILAAARAVEEVFPPRRPGRWWGTIES